MNTEKLLENFEQYSTLLKKYFPDEGIDSFLESFGVRLTTCPRGLTEETGGSYGGLISHSLGVTLHAISHAKVMDNIDKKSLARVSLIHEIGKLGSEEEELFVVQESQWHKDKLGQNFKYNEQCPKMSVGHRSLYLLQKYGIEITQDEWVSILVSQGLHFPENAFYGKTLPDIGKILYFAKSMTE